MQGILLLQKNIKMFVKLVFHVGVWRAPHAPRGVPFEPDHADFKGEFAWTSHFTNNITDVSCGLTRSCEFKNQAFSTQRSSSGFVKYHAKAIYHKATLTLISKTLKKISKIKVCKMVTSQAKNRNESFNSPCTHAHNQLNLGNVTACTWTELSRRIQGTPLMFSSTVTHVGAVVESVKQTLAMRMEWRSS